VKTILIYGNIDQVTWFKDSWSYIFVSP